MIFGYFVVHFLFELYFSKKTLIILNKELIIDRDINKMKLKKVFQVIIMMSRFQFTRFKVILLIISQQTNCEFIN